MTLQRLNLSAREVDKLQNIPYEQLAAAANEAYLQAVDDGFAAQAKDIPLFSITKIIGMSRKLNKNSVKICNISRRILIWLTLSATKPDYQW